MTSHSKMIIDACMPLSWINAFPTASALSLEEAAAIEAERKHALKSWLADDEQFRERNAVRRAR